VRPVAAQRKMAAKSFVYRAARAGLAAGSVVLYLDERGLVRPWRWVHHIVHVPALGASQPLKVDFQVLVKARPPPIGWYKWTYVCACSCYL